MTKLVAAIATASALVTMASASHAQALRERRAEIAFVVGAVGSGAEDSFADVRGLAFAKDGRILVADYGLNAVRVYSPGGQYLFSFGGFGRGPGDLRAPCCIAVDDAGLVWVMEHGNSRYSVFALQQRSAQFRWTVRMPSSASGLLDRVHWDERGNLINIAVVVDPVSERFRLVRSVLDSAGRVVARDTLPTPDRAQLKELDVSRSGSGRSVFSQPFGPRALYAFGARAQVATAISGKYDVRWFDSRLVRIRTIEREFVGPMLHSSERDQAERVIDQIVLRSRLNRSAVPFGVPLRKPPLESMFFDLAGRLWIRRSAAFGADRVADVYSVGGDFEGSFSWPSNVSLDLGAIRGSAALGVLVSASGEQRVAVLRF